jgi:hypothetical protein
MTQKIFIGAPVTKGLEQFLLPFNIDNDAFSTLFNAYAWRGRVKRKRGTIALGRLQVQVDIVSSVTKPWQTTAVTLSGGTATLQFPIGPGSVSFTVGSNTYTEPATPDGTLVGTPSGSGTIHYSTGAITISGGGSSTLTGTYSYYPCLPVMGLRNLVATSSQYPLLLSFDTQYSYEISSSSNTFYNVNFYKTTGVPFKWSGQNYQQFWTSNYQGALWATNNNPGFNFVNGTYGSGSGTSAVTFNFKSLTVNFATLVVGDQLWFNEWSSGGSTINGLVGSVSDVSGAASGNYVVTFSGNQTVAGTGIAQLMTNTIPGQDGIKWYDGDPTSNGIPPNSPTGFGWVNFAPPLTATTTTIDDEPAQKYYLVGALAVVPFKDRLIFFSPWIQTSSGASAIQLNDVALWSWNGTPYYAAPVPSGQTASAGAYYIDQIGFGGWLSAGVDQSIVTVSTNEDVLIVGFTQKQTRFVYTGNDLIPFLFYIINSELGSASTFSAITLDRGALAFGLNGLTLTSQISSQRIDLSIPNEVFQLKGPASVFAAQRISSVRDFYHEWVHFTFVPNNSQWSYPTQTLQYNYREQSWAIFYENFTAHGTYRKVSAYTWATIPFATWNTWNESWSSSTLNPLFPSTVAGNPQGFVVVKGQGTGEAPTGYISAVANTSGFVQITSTDHCVAQNDYLYFQGALGTTFINGVIGKVSQIVDANNFIVDIVFVSGTYIGLGTFTRLSQPLIQTKQFPLFWNEGRKIRLGTQKYLLDYTDNAQVTLNIYLSQDPDDAWNMGPIVPNDESTNNSLVYSTTLYTCPESSNIGLTPSNTNLQMPIAQNQYQIWHRVNTSLIGDSVQVGITLSDAQMRNLTYATAEIGLHAIQLDVAKGPMLS